MTERNGVWRGDYRELIALSVVYQTEEIPTWMVRFSDQHPDTRLRGTSTINIYKALADWLTVHRQHIEDIKTLIESGDIDTALDTLRRKLEEIDEVVYALRELEKRYAEVVAESVGGLR